jgi:hypothetical protein
LFIALIGILLNANLPRKTSTTVIATSTTTTTTAIETTATATTYPFLLGSKNLEIILN